MRQNADLIITNAQVYTVDELNPRAEAVAIAGRHICFVGSAADAAACRGPQTRLIDGQGHTLLPGFIDSHFHLLHGSLALADAQLHQVASLEELATAIRQYAGEQPAIPWLRGQGLRYGIPSHAEPLTRQHLDAIEPERPLVLIAYDVHTAWANTPALINANLLHGLPDLPGGAEVVMGADGLATGEVREAAAFEILLAQIPPPTEVQRRLLLQRGLAYLASLGITSVHNMDGDAGQATLYAALADLDELSLRVYIPFDVKPETPIVAIGREAAAMRDAFQGDMVRAGAVKFFMDGVYESYTAVSLNGYPDQPPNFGTPIFSAGLFTTLAAEADRHGLQIFVHACGDGAVRRVLDGYAKVQAQNGVRDSRHRVEHIEMLHPDDVSRFAQLGVIASMQPLHAPLAENDPDVWPTRVPESDWDRAFAWRTLRDAGATLAFGSDWPVAPPNPIWGIAATLNRKPWRPGHAAHRQTLAEAIRGYTKDAAFAEFQETVKGQIKVGMLADLVLLCEDIFALPPAALWDVCVDLTICDGRIRWQRPHP